MSSTIASALSRELQNGFSEQTLLRIQTVCSDRPVLAASGAFSEEIVVLIFILRQVASDVSGFLDAIAPVTFSCPEKVQRIIESAISESIDSLIPEASKSRRQAAAFRLILARE
jgi:hypothetical protein